MQTQLEATHEHVRREHRIDVATHELLNGGHKQARLTPRGEPVALPDPVFPRFPEKAGDVEADAKNLPKEGNPY